MAEATPRKPMRARTPTVLQMEATECGAASLAMVLAHHGRWVPLDELRQACGVSRDGSNASNILKAARGFGMIAKGFKKEPGKLLDVPVPSIIHWNFSHYMVFEGIVGNRAYLNDPSHGPRVVGLDELDECFTGVVLGFTPTEAFTKGGSPPDAWSQLKTVLGHSRDGLILAAGFSMLLILPGLIVPGLARQFVDQVLVRRLDDWVIPLCVGMALAALFSTLVTALQQSVLLRLETKLGVVLSTRFLGRLLALPMGFFTQRSTGDLAGRFAATDRVAQLLSGELATNAFNMLAVLFYVAAMAVYDWVLAVVGLAMIAANLAAVHLVKERRRELNRKLVNDQGKLLGATTSAIVSIESLKVSGTEDAAFAVWSGHQAQALSSEQALVGWNTTLTVAPTLLSALTVVAIVGVGGMRVMDGILSVGGLVAVQSLMTSLTTPVAQLVALAGRMQTVIGDLERLADVLDRPRPASPPEDSEGGGERLEGAIELRNVTFGYNPCAAPLIEGFDLTLKPGMRVALVGGSGSGKSTLGRLICGLYKPWSGEILIDGRRVEDIPPDVFARSVAYVDQDIFLFEGSVRDNLTLWDPTIPDSAITDALRDAEILADVAMRAGHVDSHVIEGGGNFSGGQRQRLEIARALVGSPSILVLDEATAALDPVTEKRIDEHVRRRGQTCIVIAHRLSTIRDCDEIIVLKHGRVVERGSHDALMAQGGAYAYLIGAEA
ncbi:MAG: NHLP family bacteriocin export ABC transporter peptidase/permease/ATPase subunit [Alphaproteobacteria bacterium]|nr:NHLP family bacteriocin export ABC transporter peptidase/permease/ATPase subunit [Alphaproteobacteria bacterium]